MAEFIFGVSEFIAAQENLFITAEKTMTYLFYLTLEVLFVQR